MIEMLEQEERYSVSKKQIKKIFEITTPYIEAKEMLDISFYQNGTNLYDLYKYIIRIRIKGDKKTLEIKKYKDDDSTCIEESINLDSIRDTINFFSLMNLQPGIYLKRNREVRKYKGLEIFIDKLDLIGNYIEIEYQNSSNALEEINEFKKLCDIDGEPEDMYGGIIDKNLKSNLEFKRIYNERMIEILKSL
jgi:adenylate cyclase class IV